MTPFPKRAAAILAACALMLVTATSASAKTLAGTVVHRNPRSHAFVVASRGGHLTALHARHLPGLGRVVTVSARRLRNGTFVAHRLHAHGRRGRARIRGAVTFVDPRHRSFVVSAKGASILVHAAGPASGGAVASSTGSLPPVGSVVRVDTSLDGHGSLEAAEVQQVGEETAGIELEGVVLAVDPVARTLQISADDDNEAGGSILVNVPAELELSAFQVGQEVSLTVASSAEGFVLQGSSCDGNAQEANELSSEQGDQGGSSEDHGESGDSREGQGDSGESQGEAGEGGGSAAGPGSSTGGHDASGEGSGDSGEGQGEAGD